MKQAHRGLVARFSGLTKTTTQAELEDVFAECGPPEPAAHVLARFACPEMPQGLMGVVDYYIDDGALSNLGSGDAEDFLPHAIGGP